MVDPGFIPGFIGVVIDISIHYILDQINIARHCHKEMNSLRDLVQRIKPIITQIQQYRLALNWKKCISNEAPTVTEWLRKLQSLLQQASEMAHECTIESSFGIYSRYKKGKQIIALISEIKQHLDSANLVVWASVLEGFGQVIESSASSSASTSATTSQPLIASTGAFIREPLIVGQEIALSRLEKLVIDEVANSSFIGVFGKGGAGKTLLLKTLFNRKEVRDFCCNGLLLWLTISQSPSIISLLNELSAQIAMYTKEEYPHKNTSQEALQIWLIEKIQGKRFVLILDDLWEDGALLLEELGLAQLTDSSNSKVIVSSRNRRTLLGMGVAEKAIITMGDLTDAESWRLFSYHAFRNNNGIRTANIHEGTAKVVCAKCGGLPLAIKAVGRAMAGITDAQEWEFAARRLPIANNQEKEAVYQRLRLSYDALGSQCDVKLQMCFLYLAAFMEDEIIHANLEAIPLWTGAELLSREKAEDESCHDPVSMGKIYIKLLADRCLIEPVGRDVEGQVFSFRMHDVLRDLAIQIAEQEENFFCRAGKGLTTFNQNECSGRIRLLLNNNKLSSLPKSLSPEEISCLTVRENNITKIPREIAGMISLRILDLSGMPQLQSLPEGVGCLKQLVYLNLSFVPITTLPASITNLVNLQVLIFLQSGITELPSGIHKWRSLKCLILNDCEDLKCLPYSISGLTSLQHLYLYNVPSIWAEHPEKQYKVASINDLGRLTQLKTLHLSNNGQTIREGTLGNLADMEALLLNVSGMAGLPRDIISLLKMRRLSLECPKVVKMESNFCEFQKLTQLKLWDCNMLEELPLVHTIVCLKQLDIVGCRKLEKLPKVFTDAGAFPSLEIFSLVNLDKLQELPIVEDGAMSALQEYTVMGCKKVKMLPESYLTLKTLKIVRVYNCPMILKNLENAEKINTKVKMVSAFGVDMQKYYERLFVGSSQNFIYDESWCNELLPFMLNLYRPT